MIFHHFIISDRDIRGGSEGLCIRYFARSFVSSFVRIPCLPQSGIPPGVPLYMNPSITSRV